MNKMKMMLFVSSHCPHCPIAENIVRKVAPQYYKYGLEFRKIRLKTRTGKELSEQFNVLSTPTILITNKSGLEVQRIVGVPSESNLKNKLESGLGLKKSLFNRIFGG